MKQRSILIATAAITAFILMLAGGIIARVTQPGSASAGAQATAPASVALDPAVQAAIQERDAAYQKLIEQANRRLEQAYAQATTGQAVQATPTPPPTPAYALSPDMAGRIALRAVPGASLTATPDLVDFQGIIAYEIRLDQGLVYVDANTGNILYNGATAPLAAGREHGEHESGEEHD